jgi:Domain of unknown function (DUF6458)
VTIGSSIFMIVAGAILRYAVTWHVAGINLQILGLILMTAGIVGLVLTLIFMLHPVSRSREAARGGQDPSGDPYPHLAYDDNQDDDYHDPAQWDR